MWWRLTRLIVWIVRDKCVSLFRLFKFSKSLLKIRQKPIFHFKLPALLRITSIDGAKIPATIFLHTSCRSCLIKSKYLCVLIVYIIDIVKLKTVCCRKSEISNLNFAPFCILVWQTTDRWIETTAKLKFLK